MDEIIIWIKFTYLYKMLTYLLTNYLKYCEILINLPARFIVLDFGKNPKHVHINGKITDTRVG